MIKRFIKWWDKFWTDFWDVPIDKEEAYKTELGKQTYDDR